MIGELPETVQIDGVDYEVRTDYRAILKIFQVFTDANLSDMEKWVTSCAIFFKNQIPSNTDEAVKKMIWFINMGNDEKNDAPPSKPVYDWEQDEQLIFSAVNNVAKKEIREEDKVHWWTFLGYFSAVGECTFSTIVGIRDKKNKSKKLEKYEREFYEKNKKLIDIKKHYSDEQLEEMSELNKWLGG